MTLLYGETAVSLHWGRVRALAGFTSLLTRSQQHYDIMTLNQVSSGSFAIVRVFNLNWAYTNGLGRLE